jgi:hypothetical protein
LPTPRCLLGKPARPSSPPSSSRRCWRASCRQTEHLPGRGEQKGSPNNQIVPHRSRQSRLRDIELPAACHRAPRLRHCGLAGQTSDKVAAKLVPPMLAHFMSTDQVFSRACRQKQRIGEALRLRPNRAKLRLLHDAVAALSQGCGPGSGIGEALDCHCAATMPH